MLKRVLEFPGAAMEVLFLADGCPVDRLTLTSCRQAQAGLSTTAGHFCLPSAAVRRFAASIESVREA